MCEVKDSVFNYWDIVLFLISVLSILCFSQIPQQGVFSLHSYHWFWALVASSFPIWDQPPGGSSRRRLRRNPGPARYLRGGEILQEEAHGQRHWDERAGARVEGPDRVVRARQPELLCSPSSWDRCGVWSGCLGPLCWKKTKRKLRVGRHLFSSMLAPPMCTSQMLLFVYFSVRDTTLPICCKS